MRKGGELQMPPLPAAQLWRDWAVARPEIVLCRGLLEPAAHTRKKPKRPGILAAAGPST